MVLKFQNTPYQLKNNFHKKKSIFEASKISSLKIIF